MVDKSKSDPKLLLNQMSYGINPIDKSLFPISSHFKEILFDLEKLEKYFDKKVTYEPFATTINIEGEDFQKFLSNFSKKFGIDTKGKYPGACFAESVAAEFGVQGEEILDKNFSQSRKICNYIKFKLPTEGLRDSLRGLIKRGTLQIIDSIKKLEDAKKFINTFGPFYMDTCTLGALFIISSGESTKGINLSDNITVLKESSTDCLSLTVGFDNSNDSTHSFNALGGNPKLIEQGTEKDWINSTADNLACVDATFAPIYNLAEKNSKQEEFLKQAYLEEIIVNEGKFEKFVDDINNSDRKKIIDPSENEEFYYYWRAYGSNYPILYKCSKEDYEINKDIYNGTGHAGKSSGKYGGIYLNYNKFFTYTDMIIPSLTYSHDTYYYYYGKSTYGKMVNDIGFKGLSPRCLEYYLSIK